MSINVRLTALSMLSVGLAMAAEPFSFIQMSDPQFGMFTENKSFEHETANFEFAVAAANRLHPKFVVVTGDLINQAGNAAQAAEYLRIAAKLDPGIRLFNVPGNHDVGNEPTPASLAAYRKLFRHDYYTFRVDDFAGFVLNSSVIAAPAKVEDEAAKQWAWLALELEKARREGARHLVVFQHHSWFLADAGEEDQYFNIPKAVRERYLELFRKFGVTHVFAGHYHRNAEARAGDLQMITTGPVGKPLGNARSGIRIVKVTDSGIQQRYYDFGELP
jgi:serine/threonine-protein phosphatase CPPED1